MLRRVPMKHLPSGDAKTDASPDSTGAGGSHSWTRLSFATQLRPSIVAALQRTVREPSEVPEIPGIQQVKRSGKRT